jgi:hypothetical protein
MKIEITYPAGKERKLQRRDVIDRAKWPFLFAAYICPIVNIATGGAAWSVIVLWSLWIVWSFVFSPDMVELNRISLFIKFIANACVLLILIDILLAPGWGMVAIPIVCFGGLAVAGVLFFTDLERQKQNMMPMLLLTGVSILGAVIGLIIWRNESLADSLWALIVMGAFAVALLTGSFMVLGKAFIREIKKRFHTE